MYNIRYNAFPEMGHTAFRIMQKGTGKFEPIKSSVAISSGNSDVRTAEAMGRISVQPATMTF